MKYWIVGIVVSLLVGLGYMGQSEEVGFFLLRRDAEKGNTGSMMMYYRVAKSRQSNRDMERAVTLLKEDESPAAEYILLCQIYRDHNDCNSKESLLLYYRYLSANIRGYRMSDSIFIQHTEQRQRALTLFRRSAQWDENAQWVMDQIILEES